ncbi:MAG: VOC family protein [Firmicutes bacterium]|nr:VOC family protein [Bacillota bacterium]
MFFKGKRKPKPALHLGSVYIVVKDFRKSVDFYEKLLGIPLSSENNGRFASFYFEGHCISILNGMFDAANPDKVTRKGGEEGSDALREIALAPNTHKFTFNFSADDLRASHARIKALGLAEDLSRVHYMCYAAPYYFFVLHDPDGNMIEVTGRYTPEEHEFD